MGGGQDNKWLTLIKTNNSNITSLLEASTELVLYLMLFQNCDWTKVILKETVKRC